MCIIFACNEKFPSEELLRRGALRNPHGAGVAWVDKKNKTVKWVKGLESSVEAVKTVLEGITSFPVLIHYRSASVGPKTKGLTHPFPISQQVGMHLEGTSKQVLMHNGTWGDWRHQLKTFCITHKIRLPDGPWSDSRAYAFMAAHLGIAILPLLDQTDRLIVLDGDGHWTSWGEWKKAEDHGEAGFTMSTDLPGPSLQRDTKSTHNPAQSYFPANRGRGESPEYWDEAESSEASCEGEGGEASKEDREAAAKASGTNRGAGGANSSPLVVPPKTSNGKLAPISGILGSPASSAGGSSTTKSLVLRPRANDLAGLGDLMGIKIGDRVNPEQLQAIFNDVRRKNGLAPIPSERGH